MPEPILVQQTLFESLNNNNEYRVPSPEDFVGQINQEINDRQTSIDPNDIIVQQNEEVIPSSRSPSMTTSERERFEQFREFLNVNFPGSPQNPIIVDDDEEI